MVHASRVTNCNTRTPLLRGIPCTKGIYTTNGLLNRNCLNTPTELCPVLHPGMPIALPNYALCFILPLTLPHSRLNEVANLGQLESENV